MARPVGGFTRRVRAVLLDGSFGDPVCTRPSAADCPGCDPPPPQIALPGCTCTFPGRVYVTVNVPCVGDANQGLYPADYFFVGDGQIYYAARLRRACGSCTWVGVALTCGTGGEDDTRNLSGRGAFFTVGENGTICGAAYPDISKIPGLGCDAPIDLTAPLTGTGPVSAFHDCCPDPYLAGVGTIRVQS